MISTAQYHSQTKPMASSLNGNQRRLHRALYALTEVAKTLTQPLELPDLLDAVMRKIPGVIPAAQIGLVELWDQSAGLFRPVASIGFDPQIIKDFGLRAGESITGKVYDQGVARLISTPQDVANFMADMRPANRTVFARAINTHQLPICTIAAPITAGEQRYGILVLATLSGDDLFTENDISFVQSIADLIALAIDRARLETRADALREARQAEHMRSEIMAVLSHELRLPLTAIQGYSTALLLEDAHWDAAQQADFLRCIDDECSHMQVMLQNILDSSLIDVDRLTIEREPLRLARIAQDMASEIQRFSDKHRILVDFPANFPILEADPRWIKQVFRNILDNAIKYSPEGGLIVMRAEVRPKDVVVSVADQGIGISPEDLIPLFEKFFRVRSTNGLKIPGTGLGLPIARAVVEAHGGRIWAESHLGEGTTLYFSLPRPSIPYESED